MEVKVNQTITASVVNSGVVFTEGKSMFIIPNDEMQDVIDFLTNRLKEVEDGN